MSYGPCAQRHRRTQLQARLLITTELQKGLPAPAGDAEADLGGRLRGIPPGEGVLLGGDVEGELGPGLGGGHQGIRQCTPVVAGRVVVVREVVHPGQGRSPAQVGLAVGDGLEILVAESPARPLDDLRQPPVQVPPGTLRHPVEDGVSDAVVVRVDLLPDDAQQARVAHPSQRAVGLFQAGSGRRLAQLHRLTRHRDCVKELHGTRRHLAQLPGQHPVDVGRPERVGIRVEAPGQLHEQEGIPPGLGVELHRPPPQSVAVPTDDIRHQLGGLVQGQRADRHLPIAGIDPVPPQQAGPLDQERAAVRLVRAIAAHEQQGRGCRRSENLKNGGGAVRISPLEVIDEAHQRGPASDPVEQESQGRERPLADL